MENDVLAKSKEFKRACDRINADLITHERLVEPDGNMGADGVPRNCHVPWFVRVEYKGEGMGATAVDIRTQERRVVL